VLWITMLLAVLAASLTSSSRTEGRLARNQLANARAEALADGAVHRAVLGLLEPDPELAWRADGRIYAFGLADGEVRLAITDEDAKVDLNGAPLELLEGLLTTLGLTPDEARIMAARIGDFRDEDDEPEPDGAEDPDYAAAGLDHGAKDSFFQNESELLQVLGMSPDLYARLQSRVTVYSGSEGIDPTRADAVVLSAVPGMTPELIETLLVARETDDLYSVLDDDVLFDLELYFIPSRESVFTIVAEARSPEGGVFVREAVIELSADPARPFEVFDWYRGTIDSIASPSDMNPAFME
jgi:general secretion pathway protein K